MMLCTASYKYYGCIIMSSKVFEGLFSGSVPVYRGAPQIAQFMPSPDSFVDANNLTPEELAKKLKQLSSDEEAYNSFFQYKTKPLSTEFQQIALMSYTHPNVACRLCDEITHLKAVVSNKTHHF